MRDWLDDFIEQAEELNQQLEKSGLADASGVRRSLLKQLTEARSAHLSSMVTVEQASELTGASPETIRRAARRGEVGLPNRRRKQPIMILRSQLPLLQARARKVGAVVASPQPIATQALSRRFL